MNPRTRQQRRRVGHGLTRISGALGCAMVLTQLRLHSAFNSDKLSMAADGGGVIR
jgi:hypothetical protein